MADKKVSALSAVTSISSDDLFMVVNDPQGTPASNKVSVKSIFNSVPANTAIKGSKHIAKSTGKAKHNYLVSYMGGIVEIKKNDKVWYDSNGLIIIGWHGSYSPPTLM